MVRLRENKLNNSAVVSDDIIDNDNDEDQPEIISKDEVISKPSNTVKFNDTIKTNSIRYYLESDNDLKFCSKLQ